MSAVYVDESPAPEFKCKHCFHPIVKVEGVPHTEWADRTPDPYFCPFAISLTHEPAEFVDGEEGVFP